MHRHLGRRASFALVASLAIAACGTAPTTVTAIDQEPIPDSVPSVATEERVTTTTPLNDASMGDTATADDTGETGLLSYRYTYTVMSEDTTVNVEGAVDPASGNSVLSLSNGGPVLVAEAVVDGVSYAQTPAVGDEWFSNGSGYDAGFDPLGSFQRFDVLRERIQLVTDIEDIDASPPSFRASLGPADVDAADVDALLMPEGELVVTADASGTVARIEASWIENDQPVRLDFAFTAFGQAIELPAVSGTEVDDPNAAGEDDLYNPLSPELVLRFSTFSTAVNEPADDLFPDPRGDFNVSLLADGTVVFVGGQIVFDGIDYHRTWQLSDVGFDRLLSAAVDAQVAANGSIGSNDFAVALEVDGLLLLDAHPSNGPLDAEDGAALAQLVDLMFDQSWLEDEFVSGPEPWIADELSFAVSRNTQVGEPTPWPLDESIGELLIETDNGTSALCLTGTQAAEAWPLVQANGFTSTEVEDGRGERFTLSPFPGHPGYRLSSDPCWDRFAD